MIIVIIPPSFKAAICEKNGKGRCLSQKLGRLAEQNHRTAGFLKRSADRHHRVHRAHGPETHPADHHQRIKEQVPL